MRPVVRLYFELRFAFQRGDDALNLRQKQIVHGQEDVEIIADSFGAAPFDMLIQPILAAMHKVHDRLVQDFK
jgi:hypothetical protein